MRYTSLPARSAGTAIAAVLALAPLSAGAQTVTDMATAPPDSTVSAQAPTEAPANPEAASASVAPPVIAPTPGQSTTGPATDNAANIAPPTASVAPTSATSASDAPADATTVFAPPAPVVQNIPETEQAEGNQNKGAATPMSAAEQQAEASARSSSTAEPAAPATKPSPVAARAAGADSGSADSIASEIAGPSSAKQMAMESDVTEDAARPVEQSGEAVVPTMVPAMTMPVSDAPLPMAETIETADNQPAYWAFGMGAVVLLGGAGVVALRRRRRLDAKPVALAPVTLAKATPLVDDAHEAEPMAEPVNMEQALITEPAYSESAPEEVAAKLHTPAFSQWRGGHMDDAALGNAMDITARREVMIAAGPSVANPFLTRKNRLRRANFLLANGGEYHGTGMKPHAPQTSVAAQTAQKSAEHINPIEQVIYQFSGTNKPRVALKPRYN